jgi:ApbE superfamily uncharacterized protein (UPF0280 family)
MMGSAMAGGARGSSGQSTSAFAARLPDGRLHLQDGPIDLVIEAFGPATSVESAYRRACGRFGGILPGLVSQLPGLRSGQPMAFQNPIARSMADAVAAHRPAFITPMAAVAGAVADAVLATLIGPGVHRAYVNNGGDIALFLMPGEYLTAAVAGTGARVRVGSDDPVRGIATSGWRGRSQSLGIADSVTVLARTGAQADAAATMIANAVNLPDHPAILRAPARSVKVESDLGDRLVTMDVGPLTAQEVAQALGAGAAHAEGLLGRGVIAGAALFLQSECRIVGQVPVTLREAQDA